MNENRNQPSYLNQILIVVGNMLQSNNLNQTVPPIVNKFFVFYLPHAQDLSTIFTSGM